METIVIRLCPAKLQNPSLELRYTFPDRIAKATGGTVVDNGYDYLNDGEDAIGIWLATADAWAAWPAVAELLRVERFEGNDLSTSAEIVLSRTETADFADCARVWPAEE